jgi:hypothetical protein
MTEYYKAVYIGAGRDVLPYKYLDYINEFISIDCEPKYLCGIESKKSKYKYHSDWLEKLIFEMNEIGYSIETEDINLIIFKNNKNQIVNYYYNIIFPDKINNSIIEKLVDVNAIIVIGHWPHKMILELIKTDIIDLYGNMQTVYRIDEDINEIDTVFNKTVFNNHFRKRVRNWYILDEINNRKVYYKYNNYEDFLKKSLDKSEEYLSKL